VPSIRLKKLNVVQLLILNASWAGLSFMWSSIHPILLPAVLLNYVPDAKKNTYLGLLTFAGLIIALILQPITGALSDGWTSRFGRRRPLAVLGTSFDFVFLAILAWSGSLMGLFIGYVGLQFSSNVAHGPMQGLLPDRVPRSQMGVASSLRTFMDMLSLVAATLLAGRLLNPITRDPGPILLVVMSVLAVAASITFFAVNEEPALKYERPDWTSLRRTFQINLRENSSYWWLIAGRLLFLVGIYGVQTFAQYYLQDVLRVADPPKQTGDLLAVLTMTMIILVLLAGWMADKYGAKHILLIGTFVAAGGMLLMLFASDMRGLIIFGSVLGAGIGLFLTSNWALANSLAPQQEAGKYLGLTNVATAGAAALSRLEGPVLDWLNGTWPEAWIGYRALFIFGALCMLLSVFFLRKIHVKSESIQSSKTMSF
jgi:MFS family permease